MACNMSQLWGMEEEKGKSKKKSEDPIDFKYRLTIHLHTSCTAIDCFVEKVKARI